jgi:DNA primase
MMALCNPVKTWLNDAYEYKFNHELIRDLIKQAVGTSGNSSVLVLPMYSRDRLTIEGFISKPVCPSPGQSKSYTTLIKDSTGMSWYFGSALADVYGRDVVIVVEDPLSAIALFQLGYHAVSLNGTHLNEKRIQELAGATRHLVLALDADATATAITYQRRYGSRFGTCRVLRLRKDIKDTPNKEARAIVSTFLGEN